MTPENSTTKQGNFWARYVLKYNKDERWLVCVFISMSQEDKFTAAQMGIYKSFKQPLVEC